MAQKRLNDTRRDVELGVCISCFVVDFGFVQEISRRLDQTSGFDRASASPRGWTGAWADAQEWVEQRNDEEDAVVSKSDAEVGTGVSKITDSTETEDSLGSRLKADGKESVSTTAARCIREGYAGAAKEMDFEAVDAEQGCRSCIRRGL